MHLLRQTADIILALIILVEFIRVISTVNGIHALLTATQVTLYVDVSDQFLLQAIVDRHGGLAAGSRILARQLNFLLQVWSFGLCALLSMDYYGLGKLGRHSSTRS